MPDQNKQIYNRKKFKPSPLISPVFGIIGEKVYYNQINTYNDAQLPLKNIENNIVVPLKEQITKKELVVNNSKSQQEQIAKSNNNIITIPERTLIITRKKVILPFTFKQIEAIFELHPNKYTNLKQIIDSNFTLSTKLYKNIIFSKIIEVYKLMRVRNKYSLHKTISICIEVVFNVYIFPAIITACKTFDELEIYLDCLEKNELNQYPCFKIIYDC